MEERIIYLPVYIGEEKLWRVAKYSLDAETIVEYVTGLAFDTEREVYEAILALEAAEVNKKISKE
jgi:high-affinity nickel permease